MYGTMPAATVGHYRHGTLHPALQPHPNKVGTIDRDLNPVGAPYLPSSNTNLRITPPSGEFESPSRIVATTMQEDPALTMTHMQSSIPTHHTVPAGNPQESHMPPKASKTLSLFRTPEGSYVPHDMLRRYPDPARTMFTPYSSVDGFLGPALTEEQMEDLRRQAAQSPFNQYPNA
jgi:hypothetical protein